jgi:AcrR family transcriptional regulator
MAETKPRERILAAATRLFYEEGILATGIDRVVAEAEVAPMTVYRHFGGKDELVKATLERWSERWLAWLRREVRRGGDNPAARLDSLWDALEKWFADEGFRGSYVANAAVELRSRPGHPAQRTIAAHRAALRELLQEAAAGSKAHAPLALHILVDGAIAAAAVDRQPGAATNARAMAAAALAEPAGSPRRLGR